MAWWGECVGLCWLTFYYRLWSGSVVGIEIGDEARKGAMGV